MFTDNYILYHRLMEGNTNQTGFVDAEGNVVEGGANTRTTSSTGFLAVLRTARCQASFTGGYYGVYFGSGDTPATRKDHTLAAPITAGLSFVTPQLPLPSFVGNTVEYNATYTVKNTSSEEITIREMGVFQDVNGKSSSTFYLMLMDRTVLEAPVVLAPGEAKQITYTIRMLFPAE